MQGLNVNDEILAIDGSGIADEMQSVRLPNPGLTLETLPAIAKKKVGDVVEIQVPAGVLKFEVLSIGFYK